MPRSSPLLTRLPREIRNQLWTFCIGNQDINLDLSASTKKMILSKSLSNPNPIALLLVSRQIYNESHPILYKTSTFHISPPPNSNSNPLPTLTHPTNTLSPSTVSLVRSLHVTYTLPTLPTTDFYVVAFASSGYTQPYEIFDWWALWDCLAPIDDGELKREGEEEGRGGEGGEGQKRKLEGLRDVRLVLKVAASQREAWRAREREVLRGVRELRGGSGSGRGGKFVLVLPWERTCIGDGGGKGSIGSQSGKEMYKGWEIERVVDDGGNVFTPFGAWNMQRELERVWESRNPLGF
ncbi:hypothetical protein DL98DRAFT_660925 [Cadophora sp. DSE1049]|nr:hypothetical protein DL98DRAFT_660925 [Cadophora sp. DSE1049]